MANERPEEIEQSGIEALLSTLAPEDVKIVEGWLTQDPMAALGAEAVGIRAIRLPEDTYRNIGSRPCVGISQKIGKELTPTIKP